MKKKMGCDNPMVVIVVCPLNSLMEDQVMSLRRKHEKQRIVATVFFGVAVVVEAAILSVT
jgi:hypothetical protein